MTTYFGDNAWGDSDTPLTFGDWDPNSNTLSGPTALPSMAIPSGTPTINALSDTASAAGPLNNNAYQPTAWEQFAGGKNTGPGWGKLALGGLQGIGNLYLGSQQLKLGKESLAAGKAQYAEQTGIQKQEINRSIQDRAQRRYDRNPELNPTPEEYYAANRLT